MTSASSPTPIAVSTIPDDGRFALRPTRHTVAMRTFLPLQLWRFVVINLRMLRMILKSHQ